mmetsp:Transcript_15349/g.25347  ORF Transcript_15349/g.25347 Transcript_15349/m.25347 type:complete len:353 (+) Transcript_15349:360-1418(+)|eukprot:CAMPEP_0184644662 /NCGR_PEP_ID=MMETSP0308-20130426/1350_1 /TAXON_ID=38269 /ORGANISM="Gloeochaete witrockiana, Strain SAG 46.84" /LENGTH=352 /DNA_ID=CAMNT_0027073329 /DNA_START=349 /DNA_END=1407 /DNA_ORIENTATION=+
MPGDGPFNNGSSYSTGLNAQIDQDAALAHALQQQELSNFGHDSVSHPDHFIHIDGNESRAARKYSVGNVEVSEIHIGDNSADGRAEHTQSSQNGRGRHHQRDTEWKEYRPWFMGTVSLLQVILITVEIILNGGFEPFSANPLFGPTTEVLIRMGAKSVPLIRQGQVYRWITPMFLHGGLLHLAFILLSQLGFGFTVENKIGPWRTGIIYFLSGVGGTLASALLDPTSISVGASGAVFGLVGSVFPFIALNWSILQTPFRALIGLVVVVAVNLAIGLTVAIVDNWCHLGGFVTGVLLGMCVMPVIDKVPSFLRPQWQIFLRVFGGVGSVTYLVTMFSLFYCNCVTGPGQLHAT